MARVRSRVSSVKGGATAADGAESDEKVEVLTRLRDRVLGLTLVLVEVDNEDDATLIFQTLNSRGKTWMLPT